MTREEIKRRAELYSALAEGKTIQIKNSNGTWEGVKIEELYDVFDYNKYRIKPKSKYRPFKDKEECWQEMQKHQPFGWIKGNISGEYKQIAHVFDYDAELFFNISYNSISDYCSKIMFDSYTFTDGAPFGIKEE